MKIVLTRLASICVAVLLLVSCDQANTEKLKSSIDENMSVIQFDRDSLNDFVVERADFVAGLYLSDFQRRSDFYQEHGSALRLYMKANLPGDENIYVFRNSYCQKTSLALAEILSIYDIETRQIHARNNGTGFHQFLEYYDPFKEKWIAIDTYMSVQYVREAELLGWKDVNKGEDYQAVVQPLDVETFWRFDDVFLKKVWESELQQGVYISSPSKQMFYTAKHKYNSLKRRVKALF